MIERAGVMFLGAIVKGQSGYWSSKLYIDFVVSLNAC